MTEVGEKGRTPPGESWRRARDEVIKLHRRGARHRYRIKSRLIEPGWWTYDFVKAGRIDEDANPAHTAPVPMTQERLDELSSHLPRCAQRARSERGGRTKVAWPREKLAHQAAEFLGQDLYLCTLPAPAIGEHWHTMTRKTKRHRF